MIGSPVWHPPVFTRTTLKPGDIVLAANPALYAQLSEAEIRDALLRYPFEDMDLTATHLVSLARVTASPQLVKAVVVRVRADKTG